MQKLEVLSVEGITSVTDDFVSKMTNGSLEAIGVVCCAANALILDNLSLLSDTTLVHLENGCRSLQTLSLKICSFRLVNGA